MGGKEDAFDLNSMSCPHIPHAISRLPTMPAAGTALGDPIEVGAALAVYGDGPRLQPLALAASKSWVGHAEPAAGLAGLLFGHAAATHALALPLMHLRTVNPYVASTLEQQQQAAGRAAVAPAVLPKQGGGLATAAAGQQHAAWGISAFAFQGTNAHALLAAAPLEASNAIAATAAAPAWHNKRLYVLPEAHLLIATASVSSPSAAAQRRVAFHAELASASLAFLWDHQVMGKPLFPGGLGSSAISLGERSISSSCYASLYRTKADFF